MPEGLLPRSFKILLLCVFVCECFPFSTGRGSWVYLRCVPFGNQVNRMSVVVTFWTPGR